MYQTGGTIKETIELVQRHEYVLPADWLAEMYPDEASRADYCDKHLLGEVPAQIIDFPKFFDKRKTRLRERIDRMLGSAPKLDEVPGSIS